VTVRVPIARSDVIALVMGAEYVIASFAFDASRTRVVERGGALVHSPIPLHVDPTLVAFREACTRANHVMPESVRIRVVAHAGASARDEPEGASDAFIAGAIGARALLDLPLDDATLIDVVATLDGGDRERAAQAFAGHTVVSQETCDD
jgi:hypothetical protein